MNKALRIRAVKWARNLIHNATTVRNWTHEIAEINLARAWLAGARALDRWHVKNRPNVRVLNHQAEVIRQLKGTVADLTERLRPKPVADATFRDVFNAWGREDVGAFVKAPNADVVRDQYGTLWVRERNRMRSIETDTGDSLDYWLFGLKRPEGMSDADLRDILRDRAFADIIKLVAEADRQRQISNAILDQRPAWGF